MYLHSLTYIKRGWEKGLTALIASGPREISIIRPSAVQAIYGPKSPCMKSTWYSQVSDDVKIISLNSTRDVDVHRRRRRGWDRGFSVKGTHLHIL